MAIRNTLSRVFKVQNLAPEISGYPSALPRTTPDADGGTQGESEDSATMMDKWVAAAARGLKRAVSVSSRPNEARKAGERVRVKGVGIVRQVAVENDASTRVASYPSGTKSESLTFQEALFLDPTRDGLSGRSSTRGTLETPQSEDPETCNPIQRPPRSRLDVRNDLHAALKLLAWSEKPHIRMESAYWEAFVHSAGMLTAGHVASLEHYNLSIQTKERLVKAYLTLRMHLHVVQTNFRGFHFERIWGANKKLFQPERAAYELFRKHLKHFAAEKYRDWTCKKGNDENYTLMTRSLVRELEQDLTAVYARIVDWDTQWGQENLVAEKRPLRELLLMHNGNEYQHLPRPLPLLPQTVKAPVEKAKFGLWKKKKTLKDILNENMERRKAIEEATNTTAYKDQPLVVLVEELELSDAVRELAPQTVRIGIWMLVYAALQTLSKLSADATGLRNTDGVEYFLCAPIEDCPPWKGTVSAQSEGDVPGYFH